MTLLIEGALLRTYIKSGQQRMAAGRKNFIFFHCPLDGVRFSETFRYYRLMHVYARVGLTLLQYNCRVKHVNQACFIRSRQKHNSGTAINTIQELSHQRNKADLLQSALSKNSIFC